MSDLLMLLDALLEPEGTALPDALRSHSDPGLALRPDIRVGVVVLANPARPVDPLALRLLQQLARSGTSR